MTWVKIDDQFWQHPKIIGLSPEAVRALVFALCYCNQFLTDGAIPKAALLLIQASPRVVNELVGAKVWERTKSGITIHDFLLYQPSKADLLAERDGWKRRKAMTADPDLQKAIRSRDGDFCRYCGVKVKWHDRRGILGGTYDHVVPVLAGGAETVANLVVCCRACNGKKGAKTLDEAGMTLRPAPPVRPAKARKDLDPTKQESSSESSDGSGNAQAKTGVEVRDRDGSGRDGSETDRVWPARLGTESSVDLDPHSSREALAVPA